MRILVCSTEYPPFAGGIGHIVKDLTEEIKEISDVDLKICSPLGPDIKIGSVNLIKKFGRIGLLYYWYLVNKYIENHSNDFDVFWFHNPLFLRKLNIKSVSTIHNTTLGQLNAKHKSYLRVYKIIASKIEKYCINKLESPQNEFICLTEKVKLELNSILKKSEDYKVIGNGINIELFKNYKNKSKCKKFLGLSEDKIVFLSVGRLVDVKQPQKIIDMHSELVKNIDSCLLFIGEGPLKEELNKYVSKNEIHGVKFLGKVEHEKLPLYYNSADYYVMASKYEGLPMTLLEAMSCGLPCIVSNIPALKIVEKADCGIMVDFSILNKEMNIINFYIKDLNKKHSLNASNYALNNLNLNKIADAYLKELKELEDNNDAYG